MTDLIKIESITPMTVFTTENGPDPIIQAIKNEVAKFTPDISTKAGREEIKSMAYKIARTKTTLDDLGSKLTEDMKRQVKVVDSSRKKIWDELETLQKDTRKPLTDWENIEKDRVANHEKNILAIAELGKITVQGVKIGLVTMKANLETLETMSIGDSWQEFKDRAIREHALAVQSLEREISDRERYEAEQAELKRLREESAARELKDREERIAKEAAEKARIDAEEKASRERAQEELLRKEKEKKDQEEFEAQQKKQADEIKRIREEQERADKEKAEAEQRQKNAEKKLAEEQERNRLATVKADEDRRKAELKAIEDERIRVQKIKDKEDQDRIARESDLAHKKQINNGILIALTINAKLTEDQAKAVIVAIVKGEIPNTAILY
jgi:hypothetical protein